VKNESRFWKEKNTSFYSEFNADSECVILFKKYHGGKKMALPPLVLWDIIQYIASDYISSSQHFRICYCGRKSNFSNKYQDFWITLY
jgi:hypothetical protein